MSEFSNENAKAQSLRIQEALAEVDGDEDQAEIAKLKRINTVLLEACELAFANLKPQGDIRKDFDGHVTMAAIGKAINEATVVVWDTKDYLQEVWGYDNPADVDQLTLDNIRENAEECYPLDVQLLREINEAKE